jgi:hypothetical protein
MVDVEETVDVEEMVDVEEAAVEEVSAEMADGKLDINQQNTII